MLAWHLLFFLFLFGIKRVEGTNCGMAFWNFRLLFLFFIMKYGGDRLELKTKERRLVLFVTARLTATATATTISLQQMLTYTARDRSIPIPWGT